MPKLQDGRTAALPPNFNKVWFGLTQTMTNISARHLQNLSVIITVKLCQSVSQTACIEDEKTAKVMYWLILPCTALRLKEFLWWWGGDFHVKPTTKLLWVAFGLGGCCLAWLWGYDNYFL